MAEEVEASAKCYGNRQQAAADQAAVSEQIASLAEQTTRPLDTNTRGECARVRTTTYIMCICISGGRGREVRAHWLLLGRVSCWVSDHPSPARFPLTPFVACDELIMIHFNLPCHLCVSSRARECISDARHVHYFFSRHTPYPNVCNCSKKHHACLCVWNACRACRVSRAVGPVL